MAAFIRVGDLIINLDCIATVRFSTYTADNKGVDIPTVNVCLMIPEGSIDTQLLSRSGASGNIEKLEFEGELASTIWSYFNQLDSVKVLFE